MAKISLKLFFIGLLMFFIYFAYDKFIQKEPKVEHITQSVIKGDISESIDAVGEVFAILRVDIGAQVSGQIQKLYVKLGDKVKKGDKIADIDAIKQINEVKKQEAQLQIYKSNLASKKIALEVATKKFQREKILFSKNATSEESFENAKDSLELAKANVVELEASIIQANINLNTAKTNLNYTKILSPIDGNIVAVAIEEGQTLNSAQNTPIIATVANLDQLEIKMKIAEGDITKVKVGQKIKFHILSETDKKFEAILDKIDPANTTISDSLTKSSSSSLGAVYYYARFIVDNKGKNLRLGMSVQNSIILKEVQNALLVPLSAIQDGFVYILENGTLRKQVVKTGINDGVNIQILSGLKENQKVVISPVLEQDIKNINKKKRMRI